MNGRKQKLRLSIILISIIALSSCWYNHKWEDLHPNGQSSGAPVVCDTTSVISYSTTIQPIIISNCATTSACHVSHGTAPTNYNNFAVVQTDAQTGSGSGTIMQRLDLPTSNIQHMPQNLGFLNACDTMKIRKWIFAGCPNN